MSITPTAYRPAQIILHWVVFAAIWVQWLFNEPMKRTIEAIQTGATPVDGDMTMALVHVGFGSAILLAVDGAFDRATLITMAIAFPATMLAAQAGLWVFARLSDVQFRWLLVALMLTSGAVLLLRTLL